MALPDYKWDDRQVDLGSYRRFFVTHCSRCKAKGEVRHQKKVPEPVQHALWMLGQKGWSEVYRKGILCPDCTKAEKTRKPTTTRSAAHLKLVETTFMTPPTKLSPVKAAVPEPVQHAVREASREDNRRIRDELDSAYDETKGLYRGSSSDQTVAEKLDVPRAWVTSIRDQFYGPEKNEFRSVVAPLKLQDLEKKGEALLSKQMDAAAETERWLNEVKRTLKELRA